MKTPISFVNMCNYSPDDIESTIKHLNNALHYHGQTSDDATVTDFVKTSEPVQNTKESRQVLHFKLNLFTPRSIWIYRFMTGDISKQL